MGRKSNVTIQVNTEPPFARRDTASMPAKVNLPLRARAVLLFGGSDRRAAEGRAFRRSKPIRAYVGPNGGGKSLLAVHDVIPSLDAGRWVLSTVRLLDENGNDHPRYIPFTDYRQLVDAEHCDVLMDEVVGVANARDSGRLPAPLQNVLVQLRRRDITLSWTAPSFARADKIMREVTQLVTECRGYFSAPPVEGFDGSGVGLWAPKRVFRFKSYDTIEFDAWTSGKREQADVLHKEWFRGPGSRAFATYDTLDAVHVVKGGNVDGLCDICDLPTRREMCKGHDPHEHRAVPLQLVPRGGGVPAEMPAVEVLVGEGE